MTSTSEDQERLNALRARLRLPAKNEPLPTMDEPFSREPGGRPTVTQALKNNLIRALVFLRLVNGDGCLSLSNIAVIVVITKIAFSQTLDLAGAATLLTVLSGYNFKRYITRKESK